MASVLLGFAHKQVRALLLLLGRWMDGFCLSLSLSVSLCLSLSLCLSVCVSLSSLSLPPSFSPPSLSAASLAIGLGHLCLHNSLCIHRGNLDCWGCLQGQNRRSWRRRFFVVSPLSSTTSMLSYFSSEGEARLGAPTSRKVRVRVCLCVCLHVCLCVCERVFKLSAFLPCPIALSLRF